MRITPQEKESILRSFLGKLPESARLYLVGSRVDDSKRGGDIDLLVVTASNEDCQKLKELKLSLLVKLKELLGDQRVDLTLIDQASLSKNPVVQVMLESAVLLS